MARLTGLLTPSRRTVHVHSQTRKAAERSVKATKESAWREKLSKETRKDRYREQVCVCVCYVCACVVYACVCVFVFVFVCVHMCMHVACVYIIEQKNMKYYIA